MNAFNAHGVKVENSGNNKPQFTCMSYFCFLADLRSDEVWRKPSDNSSPSSSSSSASSVSTFPAPQASNLLSIFTVPNSAMVDSANYLDTMLFGLILLGLNSHQCFPHCLSRRVWRVCCTRLVFHQSGSQDLIVINQRSYRQPDKHRWSQAILR